MERPDHYRPESEKPKTTEQPSQQERNEPQYESPFSLKRDLEEMRAVYEKDSTLFARRAMQALDALLKETIPHAERLKERDVEKSRAYIKSAGYTHENPLPHGRLLRNASRNGTNEGYVHGLRTAFFALYEHITGEPAYLYPLGEEPEHLKPEEGGRQHP